MPSYPEVLRSAPARIGVSLLALSSFAIGINEVAAGQSDKQQVTTESTNAAVLFPELAIQGLGQLSVTAETIQPEVAQPVAPPMPKVPVAVPAVAKPSYAVGCELYRPLLEKYSWPVDTAMLTMGKESGCDPNRVSPTNDYGLFALHNMHIFDPGQNVAAAYQKYIHPRRGDTPNWSAWFAVCSPNRTPKYEGVNC